MKCSVIICTRNRPRELDRCLSAVQRLSFPDLQVVVVDNAPVDEQARAIALRHGAEYIIEPRLGLSRALNTGARYSSGDIVAYIDDDAIPAPNWVTELVKGFDEDRTMAVTGAICPLEYLDRGETKEAAGHAIHGSERLAIDRNHPSWFEMANFGGGGDGSNMAFHRAAFEVWPGLDDWLGLGTVIGVGEDHHAFFQLLAGGYGVVRAPSIVVYHPTRQTPEAIRMRQDRMAPGGVAYATFLFLEFRAFRGRLLRYGLEGLLGVERRWRPVATTNAGRWQRSASRVHMLFTGMAGMYAVVSDILSVRSGAATKPNSPPKSSPEGDHSSRT